jgi:hypothetical protein
MTETFDRLATALDRRTEGYGVRVVERPLGPDTPAQFDGPTITLDPGYDPESRCYYLAHALGSIAQWSTAAAQTRRIFDRTGSSGRWPGTGRSRRGRRATRSGCSRPLGTNGLLRDIPCSFGPTWRPSTSSTAPVWRAFYPAWKAKARRGEVRVDPFEPRPVPEFQAVPIPTQEVLREEDGGA